MITLYTTHCPKCTMLEKQLNDKQISFGLCEDINVMASKGFREAPILEVGGKALNFKDAIKWVKEH